MYNSFPITSRCISATGNPTHEHTPRTSRMSCSLLSNSAQMPFQYAWDLSLNDGPLAQFWPVWSIIVFSIENRKSGRFFWTYQALNDALRIGAHAMFLPRWQKYTNHLSPKNWKSHNLAQITLGSILWKSRIDWKGSWRENSLLE